MLEEEEEEEEEGNAHRLHAGSLTACTLCVCALVRLLSDHTF